MSSPSGGDPCKGSLRRWKCLNKYRAGNLDNELKKNMKGGTVYFGANGSGGSVTGG